MSLQLTLRMITAERLDKLLESDAETQAAYFAEVIPIDADALARDQKRQFKRPLSQEDRDYLNGRIMYCSYSPVRVDLGPICLAIKALFHGDTITDFSLGGLLVGYVLLPISVCYGDVNLFALDSLVENIARLKDAQAQLPSLLASKRDAIEHVQGVQLRAAKVDSRELDLDQAKPYLAES